jgi:hypothetical protein
MTSLKSPFSGPNRVFHNGRAGACMSRYLLAIEAIRGIRGGDA